MTNRQETQATPTVSATLAANYGQQLRVRVCGLCWSGDKLLLVRHNGLGPLGYYWSPPGGGLNFGETIVDCLKREMLEETGLEVMVETLAFLNQYINPPLHAVEMFFTCTPPPNPIDRTTLGTDPEQEIGTQLLTGVAWMTYAEILAIPAEARHQSFLHAKTETEYRDLAGLLAADPA